MTYEVVITLLDQVEYKGLFTINNEKVYIRSLIDTNDYEDMFLELINDGDLRIEQNGIDYDIQVKNFNNDIESIFRQLIEDGFNLTYDIIENRQRSFRVPK